MNMQTAINTEDAVPVQPRRFRTRPIWQRTGLVALPVVALAAGVALFDRDAPAQAEPPPPTVTVAAPLVREVTEWDDHVGRFEASQTVEVRPRVSGAITAVHFEDGAIVQKGQLLFTIDPRPFTSALAEVRAGVASARSELALAQADLERATALLARQFVSRSDVDRLTARERAARAALAAAEARVGARALDVQFTEVRAPITGRISDRRVDAGNLVSTAEAGGGTLLTTINALDPIYFTFDSSEALFLKAQRERRRTGSATQAVEIKLQDEPDYNHKGRVDFTDNSISPQSGSIRARAVVHNPDYFLTPGMFGNMRLTGGGGARALLVPDVAVRTDQARKIVFVVENGTVAARPVTAGPLIGGLRTIRAGLSPSDRVVVQGIQSIRPGARVTERQTRLAAPAVTAPPGSPAIPAASQATLGTR